MKVSSVTMPEKAFEILRSGSKCTVVFYDNVKENHITDGVTGQSISSWDFERYEYETSYSVSLAAEIEADYDTWLEKAEAAEKTAEETKVRNYRDTLLNQCDTQYCNAELWAAMTEDKQKEWTTYKQALRDVPTQDGFPYTVNWPTMPK